jgi:hypothetical protein
LSSEAFMGRAAFVGVALALCAAAPVSAQSFKGEGPEATRAFPLAAGTATFAVEHHGRGAFTVRLLDAGGAVVDEVARGDGPFGGSKIVRIASTGEYHLDVQAPGEWKVEVTDVEAADANDPATSRGREDGAAAGDRAGAAGWLGRGFLGGLVAGPIGLGFVASRADGASRRDADAASFAGNGEDLAYAAAYRLALRDRLRSKYKRNAVIGGIVGTGVFVYALTRVIHLKSGGSSDGIPGDGGTPMIVVPIRF